MLYNSYISAVWFCSVAVRVVTVREMNFIDFNLYCLISPTSTHLNNTDRIYALRIKFLTHPEVTIESVTLINSPFS